MQINIETLLPASENSYHEHICQKNVGEDVKKEVYLIDSRGRAKVLRQSLTVQSQLS